MDAWLAALGEIAYAAVAAWGLIGLAALLIGLIGVVVLGWKMVGRRRGS